MDMITLLGLGAGGLTTAAFLPPVYKTWTSKSAKDISYGMFILFSTGVLLWLLYGIALNAAPIIIANAITLGLALIILALKFHFERGGRAPLPTYSDESDRRSKHTSQTA